MLHRAMKANDEGDFFPIFAVCLGHEAVHYILSGYDDVIKNKIILLNRDI
jgi:gamma-glutamyl hydrolase